jgi:hypothetical protein
LIHSQEVLFGTVTIDTPYSDEQSEVYSNGVWGTVPNNTSWESHPPAQAQAILCSVHFLDDVYSLDRHTGSEKHK